MAKVGPGTYITLAYEAFLESGTRVLFAPEDKPLVFRFGSGDMLPKIEEEITGLKPGDTREFVVKPEEGYGAFDQSKVIKVPLEEFPKGKKLRRGMVLRVESTSGQEGLCFVGDIRGDHFVLDFNHPLAGRTLRYRVKILDVHRIT